MTASTVVAKKSLLRATSLVSFMTMLSRISGFARDMVIAHLFGAGAAVDAFFVAFKIPNFMRRLFAEGAFSQAFIPVLSEYQRLRTHGDVREFISKTSGTLALILFVVTVVATIITPLLILLFAPGFGHGTPRFELATMMLRITFPYLMFISLTAMAGALLNTYGAFGVPSFTPVLLNFSMILTAVFLSPHLTHPVVALAWGVFIAGIAQLLFQVPFLYRLNLLALPRLGWGDEGVTRVLKLMLPGLFGVSVAQINLLLDTVFASFLQVGSVSWLYYSDRLNGFPLGVFGVAISTVILPNLSRAHVEKSIEQYSKTLEWAMRTILFIALPAMLGLLLLSGPLLTSLLHYGKFTDFDVVMTQRSLVAFSIGLPAFMIVKVFASGFYAQQNVKTPVKVGVLAMATNTVLNCFLIFPLAHAGLALSTSIAAYVNSGVLFYFLYRRGIYQPQSSWLRFSLQALFANSCLAAWLWWGNYPLSQWLNWSWHDRAQHLLMLIVVAGIIYIGALVIARVRMKDIRA